MISAADGAELVFDFSNYRSQFGDRVPAGRYTVEIETVEGGKTKKGDPKVTLWFRILGGDYNGMTVVDNLYLVEAALWRAQSFLQAVKVPTPRQKIVLRPDALLGMRLMIDVADGEPYMGRVKTEVRGYLELGGSDAPAPSPDLDDLLTPSADVPFDTPDQPDPVANLVELQGLEL